MPPATIIFKGLTVRQLVWDCPHFMEFRGVLPCSHTAGAKPYHETNNSNSHIATVCLNLLKPTGYVMHQQFNIQQLYSLPTLYLCFVFIWEQTATCATYIRNWLVFITELKSVYSAVRTGSLTKTVCILSLTLILLTTTIVAPPSNASKWQMGFNSAFKGLKV
jgi:hypothetical protein